MPRYQINVRVYGKYDSTSPCSEGLSSENYEESFNSSVFEFPNNIMKGDELPIKNYLGRYLTISKVGINLERKCNILYTEEDLGFFENKPEIEAKAIKRKLYYSTSLPKD